jgi:UDP:flavonoid glycosyltransferase YjiC (YdhE family)
MRRHALFTSAPFVGHLGPLLAQADELVHRGWRVSVACLEDGRRLVTEHAGVDFLSLGTADIRLDEIDALRTKITEERSFSRSMLTIIKTLGRGWTDAYDRTLAILQEQNPDIVIADLSSTAAISAAETSSLTCVINNPDLLTVLPHGLLPPAPDVPLLLSGKSRRSLTRLDRWSYPLQRMASVWLTGLIVARPLNAARHQRGLPGIDFQRWFDDKLILVDSAFGLEYPRPLPPNVQMVGPMQTSDASELPADYARWFEQGPPVVFANLGTIARPWPELLQRMAAAFVAEDFRVLWVVPEEVQSLLPAGVAANIRIERWVPSQTGVLHHPNVRAFVSHCGVNSVHESILGGTPVVGIPLFAAQGDMALRVEDAGVGSRLDKHRFTPEQLRTRIRQAIQSDAFRAQIAVLRETFVLAGGASRAADLIEAAAAQAPLPLGKRLG